MATVRHRRWWASTARLWPRRSGSAARGTEREQISVVDVADASFMMPLSMEETTPAPPSTGMGSSARSCARSRLPSSGAHGRSDWTPLRFRGNQGFHLGLMWWAVALWGQILSSDFRGKLAQSEMAKCENHHQMSVSCGHVLRTNHLAVEVYVSRGGLTC